MELSEKELENVHGGYPASNTIESLAEQLFNYSADKGPGELTIWGILAVEEKLNEWGIKLNDEDYAKVSHLLNSRIREYNEQIRDQVQHGR